ncbi:MAG: glycosyltransferase family 2 protein [Rikenellaceae bacterium]
MEVQVREAVVILNWNGDRHLAEFLPSVVEHTPTDVDIVVVDNGSTDSSVSMLKADFKRIKVVELGCNYGFAAGYNWALSMMEYELVVLLNSDVAVSEGWTVPLFAALRSDELLAAVSPKLLSVAAPDTFEYAGASGGFIDYFGYPFCRGRILQSLERDHGQYDDQRDLLWVSGAAFACRLSTFKKLGGFDADFFAHMEEIDLCWRFALAGYRVAVVPQSVVYHLGGGTLTIASPHKTYLNHRNNLAMLFKCAPTSQRIVVAVVRPLLDLAAAFSYLIKGQGGNFVAVFKAYKDFIAWHPRLQRKRHAIRSSRKSESAHIYKGSIILRFIFSNRNFGDLTI